MAGTLARAGLSCLLHRVAVPLGALGVEHRLSNALSKTAQLSKVTRITHVGDLIAVVLHLNTTPIGLGLGPRQHGLPLRGTSGRLTFGTRGVGLLEGAQVGLGPGEIHRTRRRETRNWRARHVSGSWSGASRSSTVHLIARMARMRTRLGRSRLSRRRTCLSPLCRRPRCSRRSCSRLCISALLFTQLSTELVLVEVVLGRRCRAQSSLRLRMPPLRLDMVLPRLRERLAVSGESSMLLL
ncbi:unnamed protein product [Prorocentrum cordatum]|uniref:Secreted protein n=1 Tax=Prorocentrum cordatum TaxID=2364126 RepID=A0ABN9RLY9_9DINO|nr:unnamed protein product [Polarella glacialis]